MREIKVDKKITNDLNSLDHCWWFKNQGNVYTQSGRPDYTALWHGHHYEIEAKAGNGHPLGMAQLFKGYQIVDAGGVFIVAFPDYTSIKDVSIQKLDVQLHANKANQLSVAEYDWLNRLRMQINRQKKTVAFKR